MGSNDLFNNIYGSAKGAIMLRAVGLHSIVQKSVLSMIVIPLIVASGTARAQELPLALSSTNNTGVEDDATIAEPLPSSMGALGDSISAGLLANFSRETANKPSVEAWFVMRSLVAAAIFQLKGLEKKDLSWSAGYGASGLVLSHARRLAALDSSRTLKTFNVAHSGDTVQDILDIQLPKLNGLSRNKLGQEYPDYVTILIGANDVCDASMAGVTSVQDYYDRLDKVVHDVLSRSPRSKIMLSSLPNIESLRQVALGARLWGWGAFEKCEDVWNAIKLCPTLTTISDPAIREQVKQRVDDYNLAARDIVERYTKSMGDRIRYGDGTFKVQFGKDHLSMDCFHPNPAGQNILSKVTFNSSWWPTSGHFDDDLKARMSMKMRCEGERAMEESSLHSNMPQLMSRQCWDWFHHTPQAQKEIGSVKYYD